jgi:hypothetical protein
MSDKVDQKLHRQLDKLQRLLPGSLAPWMQRLREPKARLVRIPVGVLFIFAGFLGFLPILGFWMLPIGVVLLSLDVPLLKRPTVGALIWAERQWAGPLGNRVKRFFPRAIGR